MRGGVNVVILSDRGTSAAQAAIPSLLLASAVHHRLVDEQLRTSAALVWRPATSARCTTWRCCWVSARRRCVPYLAYESIDALVAEGELDDLSAFEARYQYGKALNKGVVKVMSKMGVSHGRELRRLSALRAGRRL